MSNQSNNSRPIPFVKIIHQPSPVYRMRYKAEKRTTFLLAENALANEQASSSSTSPSQIAASASSQSKSKTALRKKNGTLSSDVPDGTFPKIQIVNGSGPATLIVSCVNKCEPYHVHPHRLIGEKCKSGVAVININRGETFFELAGVSIEFTKKHDIEEAINELKSKNVDPFNVGFEFIKDKSYQIDLTQLRLCFQVYLRDSLESNEIIRDQYHILKPVLSNIICNSSRKSTLQIMRTSNMWSPSNGGANVVMFLKRLEKDQKILHVKFYDQEGWSTEVKINDNSIHYQSAIMFPAPPYKNRDNVSDVTVSVKLYVPFKDDKEKQEYIRQQNAEDRDDEDQDSMSEAPTTSQQAQTSSSVASPQTEQSSDFYREIPDGKYESPRMDFIYKPADIQITTKRKLDTLLFYDFQDTAEREATEEVAKGSRKNLAKRQKDLIKNSIDTLTNPNVSEFLTENYDNYQTDPIFLNFVMKHSKEFSATNNNSFENRNNFNLSNDPNVDYQMITEHEIQTAIERKYDLEKTNQHTQNQQQPLMNEQATSSNVNMIDPLQLDLNQKQDEYDIDTIMNLLSASDSF